MTILSLKNLNISANVPLVRDVSFDIHKSEILALVGESGSGKTLTALSIMGLLPAGLAHSEEITPDYKTMRGSQVGMIFQEPMTSLNPLHTVEKQIGEAIRIHNRRMAKSVIHARIKELLDKVGLSHFKDRLDAYPHQLSGGERQRVMIAMAIANSPALLIADEPTTALDVTIQAQILALLKELQQSMGMAVLLITHDLTIVRRIADRVIIMSQGEIVETGKTADIFATPKHAYTQKLLAAELKNPPLTAPKNTETLLQSKQLCVTVSSRKGLFSWTDASHKILDDISIFVPKGATLGVVGESGSGKTTLALALLRLMTSSGVIEFAGTRLDLLAGAALRAKRRDMQCVFQDPYASLNPRMSIGEIIAEGLDVHEPQLTKADKDAMVDVILQEVGLLADIKQRYPHEFSGGQRQRISIARALILRPRLIILDEPTSALDLSVQAQILDLLKKLQEKYGLSYIFISHDLRTVRAISHYIVVLQHGKIVESGEAQMIFEAPQKDYTRALMKAAFA